jgi:hypothetical protein
MGGWFDRLLLILNVTHFFLQGNRLLPSLVGPLFPEVESSIYKKSIQCVVPIFHSISLFFPFNSQPWQKKMEIEELIQLGYKYFHIYSPVWIICTVE